MATDESGSNTQRSVTVSVHFLGYAQDLVGIRDINLNLNGIVNLKDVLKTLAEKIGSKFHETVYNPATDTLSEKTTIIINGRHYTALDGLETPIKSGDDISFFPPLGGG
ncbi:MAG: MoaD family protein [Candidatus Helarchaeota archaeon]